MKKDELLELLSSYDHKISQANAISLQAVEGLQVHKSKSVLTGLLYQSVAELLIGVAVTVFLALFIYYNLSSMSLVVAAAIIMVFIVIAISGCIRQIIRINQFDYSRSVSENQQMLASLQAHIITYLRLSVLQLPLYFAYIMIGFKVIFGVNIWQVGDTSWLISQAILSILFAPLAWWLYRKISYKNLHISWVKRVVAASGGKHVTQAMAFLQEIDSFRKG
ncbi:hypothetical protein [uncultured Pontibacter sp.]|uniref:hypothetical protein n=1 Tax=uncultured Pontibacter sp. TaxID=453356 RepID=UPI0026018AEB|nr:hypothetical protein [uncultured Pontibacter sp.]